MGKASGCGVERAHAPCLPSPPTTVLPIHKAATVLARDRPGMPLEALASPLICAMEAICAIEGSGAQGPPPAHGGSTSLKTAPDTSGSTSERHHQPRSSPVEGCSCALQVLPD
jgi:hypothetical protein